MTNEVDEIILALICAIPFLLLAAFCLWLSLTTEYEAGE